MKALRTVNMIFMGLPIVTGLIGFATNEIWILSLLLCIPLGLCQVILSIILGAKYKVKKTVLIYYIGVVIYFVFYFGFIGLMSGLMYSRVNYDYLYILGMLVPVLLAFYFTFILHTTYQPAQTAAMDENILDQI